MESMKLQASLVILLHQALQAEPTWMSTLSEASREANG
jgi:hypothetical protein